MVCVSVLCDVFRVFFAAFCGFVERGLRLAILFVDVRRVWQQEASLVVQWARCEVKPTGTRRKAQYHGLRLEPRVAQGRYKDESMVMGHRKEKSEGWGSGEGVVLKGEAAAWCCQPVHCPLF